jgi:hypothetical protein
MLFLIKYTIRTLLLLALTIILYQITIANQPLLTDYSSQPLLHTFKTFLKNSNDALT